MPSKFIILCSAVIACCVTLIYYSKFVSFSGPIYTGSILEHNGHTDLRPQSQLLGNVELTIRLTSKRNIVQRFLCDLLRSIVVFWNSNYGDIVLILDSEDAGKKLPRQISTLSLPHKFRIVYEDSPKRLNEFSTVAKKHNKSVGYYRMLYSSFLMDLYTNDSTIIAWTDTDVILTMPIIRESIVRNSKLIVKGVNTFDRFSWVPDWDHSTVIAIGHNMVADFMTYFPVFVYPSTIRNCRKHIMKRLGTEDFEEAFLRFAFKKVSPVNIILTYAYHYERHLYDWHIDLGGAKLRKYNEERLQRNPLSKRDTTSELHVSIHSAYFESSIHPLERALCYTQMNLQRESPELQNASPSYCEQFQDQVNFQLFEFQTFPAISHRDTWCAGEKGEHACARMISERYEMITQLYRSGELRIDVGLIGLVERFAVEKYRMKCPKVRYKRKPG